MSLQPAAARVTTTATPGRAGPDVHRLPAERLSGSPRTADTANAPITMRERLDTSADAYHARHPLQTQEHRADARADHSRAQIAINRTVQLPLQFPTHFRPSGSPRSPSGHGML